MSGAGVLSKSIRPLRLHEVGRLKKIFDQALESDFNYYSKTYLQRVRQQNSLPHLTVAILRPQRLVLGLWVENELAGYTIACLKDKSRAYIYWLYIQPQCRGLGLGKYLLTSTLQNFQESKIRRVELITHNRKDFYIANGFNVDRFAPKLIEDVDVYLMSRELS